MLRMQMNNHAERQKRRLEPAITPLNIERRLEWGCNWLPRNGSNAVPFLFHWVSGHYWVKAMDDAIEEKPTIHRFRRAPPRAPGQPQPWPAYEPPGDTTPRYNNHTINYVDAVKKRFPCNSLIR